MQIEINDEQLDRLGRLVDKADNFAAAGLLPLPAKIHAEALMGGMADIRDELRALYVDVTGENPWEPGHRHD